MKKSLSATKPYNGLENCAGYSVIILVTFFMLTNMLVNTTVSKSDYDQLSCSLSAIRLSWPCLPCLFVPVAIVLVRAAVNHLCMVFKLVSNKLWRLCSDLFQCPAVITLKLQGKR